MPIVEEINSNPVSERSGKKGLDSKENSDDDFFKKRTNTKKNFASFNL